MWALTTKMLVGPGPYSTYEFQEVLPKEPLPSLDDSLNMYVASVQVKCIQGWFRTNEI